MTKYLLLAVGFFLLIRGADLFVEASSSVARMLRVPSIIIGLTTASLAGNNEIAVGNVIGSNIFNLMVVLGTCAAIHPFAVRLRWDYGISIGVAVALFVMICFDHYISRADAFMLLAVFVLFVGLTVRDALVNRVVGGEEYHLLSPVRSLVYIVGGLAAIILGGDLVVDSASEIAASFGLSQTLIGLTVVAFGTSLPELVTSVVASRKGENGLALGNVIGSNIFNILMVLAASAAVKPIYVSFWSVIDAGCLIVFSIFVMLWCRTNEKISRAEGLTMLAMYAAYMVYICIR